MTLTKDLKIAINKYYQKNFTGNKYIPGKSYIPASQKLFDKDEILLGVEAILDGWWTEGRFSKKFEKKFGEICKIPFVTLVNSGSSANLLAVSALFSSVLKNRALKKGDEIITTACSFPTTLNPIIQNGCLPVFVDVDLNSRNAIPSQIRKAVNKRTKAIILAHTLGNPFDLKQIIEIAQQKNLWLIEDCCDALGSLYDNKPVGTFGDIACFSFYPAHQITMGEGGAVITKNPILHRIVRQFRDWGRDCWCDTGRDDTCKNRFGWQLGKLPKGYDHKYIYSQIGYNLKITDMQAAIGVAQLKKLPMFIKKRQENFNYLYNFFKQYQHYFYLPEKESGANPCWFGFMVIIKKSAPFSRLEMVNFLESHQIATRSLFGGNLLLHPAYKGIKYRLASSLINSDIITRDGFWIGLFPGINKDMLEYMTEIIQLFISRKTR